MVAIVLLGLVLLGVAVFAGPDGSASDPATAAADIGQVTDPSRARHDTDESEAKGELLVESLEDSQEVPTVGGADAKALEKLRVAAESQRTRVREISFRIATFNVLASQHTDGPGGWPDSGWRSAQAVGYIKSAHVSIVGLQEVKSGQLNALTAGTGFEAWPGGSDPDNSVIWDPAQFEFVSGDAYYIRFMHGTRPQTILRLRHKATRQEIYVLNTHVSAGGGQYAASRAAGHQSAVSTVNRLKSEDIPIFLTGDMNDREVFFCRVVPPTGMVAAAGGSTAGGCRPPGRMPVDWIVATPQVSFSNFVNDTSTLSRRISDHHFVSATATIQAGG